MFCVVFVLLGCFLKMRGVTCDILDSSEQIEDFLPLLFPKTFLVYGRNLSDSRNHLGNHGNNKGYLNISKGNLAETSQDGYVKGYSLKIPKLKLMEKGYPMMKEIEQEARTKRGVLDLYNMVSCATGCNPLNYKGYGCFCGFMGSGYPVDGIDRCCKTHDWCYDSANCPMYLEYFVPYYWKCYSNRPYCAFDHGDFGAPGSCADKLCECDRTLSECLKRYHCPSRRAFCKSSPLRFLQNAFMFFT